MTLKQEEQYKKALGIALDALVFYGKEDSYHAVFFMADPPFGDFMNDFSHSETYGRTMPGKRAREAIKRLSEEYPDLSYYGEDDE